jgi:osmotically-inducible protein OsmY
MDQKTCLAERTVCPGTREETYVAQQVARRIGATGRFAPSQLDVSAASGVVTLRGRVSSYYQKQVAQTVALGVEGVRRLENQMEVT